MRQHDCDLLAVRLTQLGQVGASLPPVWDGCGISQLVAGPQGEFMGKILPGRGFLLFEDLKNVGITRELPYVFQRSIAFQLRDLLKSERGAITSLADLNAAREANKAGAKSSPFVKTVATASNQWSSLYGGTGVPAAGTFTGIPGGATFDQTTTGALNYAFTAPTNPDKAFLMSFGLGSPTGLLFMGCLVDMLVGAGNIDTTSTSAQTVNTTALTRNTDGKGVMVYVEVTAALGTGAASVTLNKYTNQAGTTLRTTGTNGLIASASISRLPYTTTVPFFGLQAGDYGVRSVEEVTMSAALTGSGILAVVLCKPIMWIPGMSAGYAMKRDDTGNINGATQLAQTSGDLMGCLNVLLCAGTSGSIVLLGDIEIAVG